LQSEVADFAHVQPKFLSKEERAKIAIAKRAAELKEQRERDEKARSDRETLEREAQEVRQREQERERAARYGSGGDRRTISTGSNPLILITFYVEDDKESRYGHPEKDTRHGHGRRDGKGRGGPPQADRRAQPPQAKHIPNAPTGPRADRLKSSNPPSGPASSSATPAPVINGAGNGSGSGIGNNTPPEPSTSYVPPMTESDLIAVRDRYLGVNTKKRKIRKMNDRKFVFDWNVEEDTFSSDSPVAVGANRQGAQVMFGRGHVGGFDDGGGGERAGRGTANLADAMERRMAVKSGLDERHWSEKPLEEMKERDWRIFREDFSIAARGMSAS